MGNNGPIKLKIQVKSGCKCTMELLGVCQMCYVPNMKKNLISLVLVGMGLLVNLDDSGLKDTKGALVVKGIQRNLFYLQDNTVLGGVAAASHILDTDDDTSRLWHMRWGYAEECALQTLVKQGECEHCVIRK